MIPPVILSKATKLAYGCGIPAADFLILTGLLDEGEKRSARRCIRMGIPAKKIPS